MKLFRLITLSAVLIYSGSVFSQSTNFTDPEPSGMEPVSMTKAEANTESSKEAGACGYSKAFVASSDLNALMDLNDCVGVRIYNGKEDSKETYGSVIVVAIDGKGKEIGKFGSNKYMNVQCLDSDPNCQAKKVSKNHAKGCVETVAYDNAMNYQKVFFSRSFIQERIANSNGISIMPGTDGKTSTMMISGAKLSNGKITEMEDYYYRSQLPCPTDCGETDNYLVDPNK